jgi:hypothetical protein
MLAANNVKEMAVFWGVVPCSLEDSDRCFRGAYCLHYQGDDEFSRSSEMSVNIYQPTWCNETAFFIPFTVRTSSYVFKC